jgi:alkanesulfonate monooxygenase SsuD/methylene tetrahydromethanopterin reductase-like flavin-dependent oxidoreductase (luciferase family)
MNVGLYFDLRNPPLWRRPWAEHYALVLDLCEAGDRLGAHSLWFGEHHGFDDGYLPQPLTFAAAVAARTKAARIGTSIVLAPLRPAAQIAEEAAVVDIISGGRLDLGLGAGYRKAEFALYQADHGRRGRATFERIEEIRTLWEQGTLTPPPVQHRIPIWVGASGDWSARRTGLAGEGLLKVGPELLGAYRQGLRDGGHDAGAARMSGGMNVFLSEDPERDWPLVAPHVGYQWDSYARHDPVALTGDGQPPPPRAVDPEALRAKGIESGPMLGFVIATPDQAADRIRTYLRDTPTETIFVWGTLPGLPAELAERHVELVCHDLRPRLAAA